MEIVNNSFEKGLSKDFSPGKQPIGTYLHAENIVRDIQGTVKSERGTILLAQVTNLTNPKIIGETVIGEEIIFFVVATEGSLITKLKADNTLENILFTGDGTAGTGSETTLVEKSIGGTSIDGYDEAYLEVAKTADTNLLVVGDSLTLSGFGDNGVFEIKSIHSVSGNKWQFIFTTLWHPPFDQTGTVTWYVEETVEVDSSETFVISPVGSSNPEEMSFAKSTSALYDLVFTLVGATVSVEMVYRSGGSGIGDPIQVDGIIEYSRSSKVLPESFRPTQAGGVELYSDGAVSSGYGFSISSTGVVAFTLLDSEFDTPRQVLFTGIKTYTSSGQATSTIPPSAEHPYLNFSYAYPIDVVSRKNHKGEIIIYFTDNNNIPRRINTSTFIDASNFDNETKLFLNPNLPRITGLEVVDGGGVTTGLYNFAARLGTITGNTTSFSQISNGIPVVNESQAVGELQYDGAPPQTVGGKTIKISIDNIDTTYQFIEIAAVTYTGEDNVLTANIIAKLPITTTSIVFEYYSDEQIVEAVLVEELAAEAIEYIKAKNLVQKDNFLFLANLQSNSFAGYDNLLQGVADDIEVYYEEKPDIQSATSLIYSATATPDPVYGSTLVDIKLDELIDTTFKNYKNPEYTDKYKTYQRDEVYSFALVPIFTGGIHGSAYHIPGWAANPTFDGAPGNEDTLRLRGWKNADDTYHHRMPSVEKSPPFTSDGIKQTFIPIGITFKEINFPESLLAILEGFTIVRQRRDRPNNGIIIAQGLAHNFYNGPNDALIPIPDNGKCDLKYLANGSQIDYDFYAQQDTWDNPYFAFYSPDIIHGLLDSSFFGNVSSLKQVSIKNLKEVASNNIGTTHLRHKTYGVYYCDFEDISVNPPTTGGLDPTDRSKLHVSQDLVTSFFYNIVPFQRDLAESITLPDGKIIRASGMSGKPVVFKLSSGKLIRDTQTFRGNMSSFVLTGTDIMVAPPTGVSWSTYTWQTTEINNVYAMSSNVYGDLSLAEYIKVEEFYFDNSPGTEVTVYGGDTFLTRYDFNIGVGLDAIDGKVHGNISTYLETRGNYAYRHYEAPIVEGDTTTEGTMPYAPKFKHLLAGELVPTSLGIWNYELSKGPGEAYNKQYNFENTINKYYPVDVLFDAVDMFPNRITYSVQSFENEKFDAYRTFLTNNFHDIPKETGEITNLFEYNSILYAHTPHSLWHTFVNEKTFVNSSSGEIVLGNGGLFPIPSKQLYTEEGGFAGTSAKWGAANTPYGRMFIDNHQRKVFILADKGVKELSDPHLFVYFTTLLDSSGPENYKIGYDPLNKRAILSIVPTTTSVVGTSLSYAFELQSWSSIHTYSVDRFATRDNKLIGTSGGGIYEMATGPYNSYFGELSPSKLQFVMNAYPSTTKDFLNLKWIQRYKQAIFSEVTVKTEDFTTGLVTPILVTSFAEEQKFLSLGAQHVNKVGGEYRMTIPPDNNPDVIYVDEFFRPTIKGKYGIVELTYFPDLALNSPLELEYIGTEFLKIAE